MERITTRYGDMAAVTYELLLAELESWLEARILRNKREDVGKAPDKHGEAFPRC